MRRRTIRRATLASKAKTHPRTPSCSARHPHPSALTRGRPQLFPWVWARPQRIVKNGFVRVRIYLSWGVIGLLGLNEALHLGHEPKHDTALGPQCRAILLLCLGFGQGGWAGSGLYPVRGRRIVENGFVRSRTYSESVVQSSHTHYHVQPNLPKLPSLQSLQALFLPSTLNI